MKRRNLLSRSLGFVVVCIMMSIMFSGCGLSKIVESRKIDNATPTDIESSIDKTPVLTDEEYEFLDNIACSLYYAKFSSTNSLDDSIVLEYISCILHNQDLIQNDYLVTPEKTAGEYKLDASVCKSIAKALFDYELSSNQEVGGKFLFPYAGGVTPNVDGRDTYPLEDGSFSIIYTIKAEGVDGQYIINDQVTFNVVRQNNQYSKFRIISIVSADG